MCFFRPNIKKLSTSGDVGGLIKILHHNNPEFRAEAARTLGKLSNLSAVPALIIALDDPWEQVQEAAIIALGCLHDNRSVKSLVEKLKTKNKNIRLITENTLASVGDAYAIEPLIQQLFITSDDDEIKTLISILVEFGDEAAKKMTGKLLPKDVCIRHAVIDFFCRCNSQVSIKLLTNMLNDTDKSVRMAVADALDKLCWKPNRDEAAAYYWIVRQDWNRCASIGEYAIKALLFAYEYGTEQDKKQIEQAILLVGTTAIRPLVAELGSFNHSLVKIFLLKIVNGDIKKLIELINETILEPIFAALQSPHKYEKEYACDALDFLNWSPSGKEAAYYWVANKNYLKCIQIGSVAVPALVQYLDDMYNPVPEISDILGEIGDDSAVPALFRELDRAKHCFNKTQRKQGEAAAAIALYKLFINNRVNDLTKTRILKHRSEIEQAATQETVTSVEWFDAEPTTTTIGKNIKFP